VLRGELQHPEIVERVIVPQAIYQWKRDVEQRGLAQALQLSIREALQSAFHRGLSVVAYERDADGNGCYLLGPWKENS
jgi:predicted GNAT superfamily acetyltransferase